MFAGEIENCQRDGPKISSSGVSAVSDSPLLRNPFKLITIVTNLPLEKLLCRFLRKTQKKNDVKLAIHEYLLLSAFLSSIVSHLGHFTFAELQEMKLLRYPTKWMTEEAIYLHVLINKSSINLLSFQLEELLALAHACMCVEFCMWGRPIPFIPLECVNMKIGCNAHQSTLQLAKRTSIGP